MEIKDSINVFITGDYCPVNRLEPLLPTISNNLLFGELLQVIQSADIAVTNLEAPITAQIKPELKTGPSLKLNTAALSALQGAGFTITTLANNHIMDYGVEGLKDTLHALSQTTLDHVGAGLCPEEINTPLVKTVKGKRIAFLNFSENEWSTIDAQSAGANPIEPISNYYQIQNCKLNADCVIVICHGGHEMYQLPSPRMKSLFRFYVDAGANAIINHHPHVISGYEVYKGAPIFYSLGNFIFDAIETQEPKWNTGIGVMLRLSNQVEFEIFSFVQCLEQPFLRKHTLEEAINTKHEINRLNEVIQDDNLLNEKFSNYIKSVQKMYNIYLEPHNFRYLYTLQNRFAFPSVWTSRKRRYLLNLIRCEAHRDVITSLLKSEYTANS